MKINMIKCHGSGNDFVLVDNMDSSNFMNDKYISEFAKAVCNRNGSIGADGVLMVLPSTKCHAKMRIFNADGTEPEMCGNGLRCVGRYVTELLSKDEVEIETMKATYRVRRTENIYNDVYTIQVDIKSVDLNPESLPMKWPKEKCLFEKLPQLSNKLLFSAVSITNPHLVSIVDNINLQELVDAGTAANSGIELLPKGVNVNFAKLIGPDAMYVKTFERGVGLTASCGTGMISSSIIACISDISRLNRNVTVYNDGGAINTCVNMDEKEKYSVSFMGNATFNYSACIDFNIESKQAIITNKIETNEQEAYDVFLRYLSGKLKNYNI